MKRFGMVVAMAGLAAVGTLWANAASADAVNNETALTFNKAIRVPGVTLPAGTYTFLHPDVMGDRHIVRILSKDHKTVFATLLTIPNERLTATDETVIMFRETPAGSIPTLRAWFYPGEKLGDEFVYSPEEARRIAAATGDGVLSQPDIQRVNAKGGTEPVKAAPQK